MTFKTTGFFFVLLVSVTVVLVAQENEKQILGRYQAAASKGGDAKRGEVVFKSKQALPARSVTFSRARSERRGRSWGRSATSTPATS
ncbi:MAG: hypothetical protein Ct9H300mP1_12920 [Planctomycetaceae bacterium]|nr:MAG: hypothetical protein Ct9H300mP1_12920 [Planctomycetaceae bacterium]